MSSQDNSVYPYISKFKKPQWYPFSLIKSIPDFYIPNYEQIIKFFQLVSQNILNYPNLSLENLYYYLIMGKYLRVDLTKLGYREQISRIIINCEIRVGETLGFKFSPYSQQKVPDIWSTAYALACLKLLGKYNGYIINSTRGDLRREIRNFIYSLKNKNGFLHCSENCNICKKTSEYHTLYYILEALLILEDSSTYHEKDILPFMKKSDKINNKSNLFRLLSLKFFGNFDEVNVEELEYFLPFQEKNGGFSFKKGIERINDSFWIVYLFENYKFLIEYPRGNMYPFIIQKLKQINLSKDPLVPLKMMNYTKLLIILAFVWENLIEDLEKIIFNNLTKSTIMDINELTIRGGVRNAEYEIIAFINLKYNLKLDIIDNSTRFGQFFSRLTPLEQYFANILYNKAKNYVRFDISEIVNNYNKGKAKSIRIQPEILLKLLDRMMEGHFFSGKIIEKSKLFKKIYSFNREQFVPKVIICNRSINYNDILKEKRKLEDVKEDIFNMTNEMKESSKNIMKEVESLIFAEEIEYAEKRLKSNIRKALFDAEFFNSNVQQSIANFEYVKAKEALREYLPDWENLYYSLQSDFQNVNLIMQEKINESIKIQHQKDLLKELENHILSNITDLGLSFDLFKDAMRKKLDTIYSRENVLSLREELLALADKIRQYDQLVIEYSQKIIINDDKVKKKRKNLIDDWVSQKTDFEQVYTSYYDGFKIWFQELSKIDNFYAKYVNKINELENDVNGFVADKDFNKAYTIIDRGFLEIHKEMEKESESFSKEMNRSLKKQKKLYLLLVNLEKEWDIQKKQLEELIEKISEKIKENVEIDKNRQLKEDFIRTINQKIDFLDETILSLENQMNRMLLERIPTNEIIERQFKILQENHIKANKEVQKQLKLCEDIVPYFRNQVEPFLIKWERFQTTFEPRSKNLKDLIYENIIKKALKSCVHKTNSNQIDLAKIADSLNITKKIVRNRVENMLNISKISGELIEGTCHLILHNDDWILNKRLRLFIDGEIDELKNISGRILQLYDVTISNSTFRNNVDEFHELNDKFILKKDQIDKDIKLKINELKPNKNNNLYFENIEYYRNKISELHDQVNDVLLKANKSVEFIEFVSDKIISIKEITDVKFYNLNETLENRKNILHSKNKQWLNNELKKIDREIEEIKSDIKTKIFKLWNDIPDSEPIQKEIELSFETQLQNELSTYQDLKENLYQKILNFEYVRVREEMEKILLNKEDLLNNHLGKIQYDIENKIENNEFKVAMEKLILKINRIEVVIKKAEKDLKLMNKQISQKSKVFPVKSKYLLDRWDIFIEEYLNVINEKRLGLEKRIIESYIKSVIHVFKDEYISFNYLSKEFGLKKEIIEERLITLIGERRLPGKIYPEFEIYYENDEAIKRIDPTSIELMKVTNVNTYLLTQKVKRIFMHYSPIFTTLASILTVFFYVFRIIGETHVPWWSVVIVTIVLFLILFAIAWIKRGEKKIKDKTNLKQAKI